MWRRRTFSRGVLQFALVLAAAVPVHGGVTYVHQPSQDEIDSNQFNSGRKVALVIGIDTYSHIPGLKFAGADARSVASALTANGYQVELLLDEQATRAGILAVLRKILSDTPQSGTFIWYFAGSGGMDSDGRQYMFPSDQDPANLDATGLGMEEIANLVGSATVNHKLMMMDACSSFAVAKTDAGNQRVAPPPYVPGLAVLDASRPGQPSYEFPDLGHGVFSNFVIEGLKGKAAGRNGVITFLDLSDYVSTSVRTYMRQHGEVQVPFSDSGANTDFIVAAKYAAPKPVTPAHAVEITDSRARIARVPNLRRHLGFGQFLRFGHWHQSLP